MQCALWAKKKSKVSSLFSFIKDGEKIHHEMNRKKVIRRKPNKTRRRKRKEKENRGRKKSLFFFFSIHLFFEGIWMNWISWKKNFFIPILNPTFLLALSRENGFYLLLTPWPTNINRESINKKINNCVTITSDNKKTRGGVISKK